MGTFFFKQILLYIPDSFTELMLGLASTLQPAKSYSEVWTIQTISTYMLLFSKCQYEVYLFHFG